MGFEFFKLKGFVLKHCIRLRPQDYWLTCFSLNSESQSLALTIPST